MRGTKYSYKQHIPSLIDFYTTDLISRMTSTCTNMLDKEVLFHFPNQMQALYTPKGIPIKSQDPHIPQALREITIIETAIAKI